MTTTNQDDVQDWQKRQKISEDRDKYFNENIKDIIYEKFTDFLAGMDEYEYEEVLSIKKELDDWIKKIEILKLNPKKCPKCGSNEVLKIEYGEPDPEEYGRPDLYFAGCVCLTPSCEWICKKCHWEWGKKNDGGYNEDFSD